MSLWRWWSGFLFEMYIGPINADNDMFSYWTVFSTWWLNKGKINVKLSSYDLYSLKIELLLSVIFLYQI